ncbi:hypothetical protein G6F57_011485 [Rhizopus arrhizus]|uniref:Kinetochore protein Ndc80 CH domain-containing protein n=1 Tax=Rhizopus oryzae TaxID=64495 RepID=A0A9P6WZN8_RHIOR|nr:hypothetical protein G6F23_008074 [Rhizopus arrhizus]KAG1407992.1 hypothetical protein G6F58_009558 [Rhizopus delemar]KAG0756203.1 hypothetical protein G6F24_011311 [Rhizopus arrhizus]KAG0789029.1 hypothetical protein G6F22_006837 [Rhizopus arrhizus]KAG0806079.1 hypothetical protein G6F20_011410 [Rhizopus arrhizus]
MAEISEDARRAIISQSRKRQSVLSLSESARKIQRLSLNTPERLNYYFDRLQTPEQQADRIESRPVTYDYDEERTINSSRTSILSEASLSEYVRQFNESQQETHERKTVYDTKPFKDPEQQKGYITKIASFLLQTEYAKELPSIRRSLRSLTSSDFQAMVRHLLKIIDPDIEFLRNFHEELPKTLRMLQCPLADVITPKTLLSIGAPHSYPNFLALLYWMAELCKGIQAPINDDDDDMSGLMFDKNYFDYIFSNHAFNAQTEYMNGMEDMSESNKEFEEVLAKTELMAADIKEKISFDIESLQDQLEEFHRTNPTLEYVTKRNIDLTTDIEKFKAYCEKKSRKIEKSVALEGKSKEQIARFEREKEIIEAEINKHSQDLQNRNLTVDEVNTTLLELKISTKLAAIPALEIQEDELKIEFDPISEDPIKDFPIDFQTKHIPALEKVYKYYREEVHTMTISISKLREKLEEIVKEISDIQAKTQLNMKMSEKRKEEYEEREAKWQQDNLTSVKLLEAEEREIEERETTAKNELSAADQELYEINKQVIERRIEIERNKAENQEKYLRFVQDLRRKIIEIEEAAKKTHEQKIMSDSLDMSTASLISNKENTESNSLPSPPKESQTFLPNQLDKMNIQPSPVLEPLPVDTRPPSSWAFIKGHTKYCAKSALNFIFKDNNLPLLINMIYHFTAARALVTRPWKTTNRYIYIASPVDTTSRSLRYQIEQTTAVAVDTFRALGVMHFALGLLSALALKERRASSERSALTVLTMASIGHAWAYMSAYWQKTGSQYTLDAIREVGTSNLLVMLMSVVALSKTIKRTNKFI